MSDTVRVRIENAYSDGHESESVVDVAAPTVDLEEWWQDVVYPHTGDGHGVGTDLGSCYTATIIEAPAGYGLVNKTCEWVD